MLEETISEIRAAEEAAQKLLDETEKNRHLTILQANKKAQNILREAENSAQQEGEMIRAAVLAEAEEEIKKIRQRSQQEKESIINNTTPKLTEARKLCQ